MKKDIIIAVSSSVITAILLGVTGFLGGFVKTEISDSQVNQAARQLVDKHYEVLVARLIENEEFMARVKGEKGDTGPKGERGEVGPVADICNRKVAIQGRIGQGFYIGENNGNVYSKSMQRPGAFESFMIRCL